MVYSQKELMLGGHLYLADDAELAADFSRAKKLLRRYNQTTETEEELRRDLLRQLFGRCGEKIHVEPPFYCDYGCHISVGESFYANYDCIIIDVCDVVIGRNVFFGPRVGIYTAGHPLIAEVRNTGLEYGKKVVIGDNVWIGGNVVINPGVTIGDNTVIGSGAVVTKDIPGNVIAAGNPCRILRKISAEDEVFWREKQQQYLRNRL